MHHLFSGFGDTPEAILQPARHEQAESERKQHRDCARREQRGGKG